MPLCLNCRVTPVQERDRFCILCGFVLRKMEVTLDPPFVLANLGGEGGADEVEVAVRVRNVGQFGARVRLLPADVAWVVASAPMDEPVLLPAGGTEFFRVRVNPLTGLAGAAVARLRVGAEEGAPGEFRDYEAQLAVYPQPSLRVTLAEGAEVWMDEVPTPTLDARVGMEGHRETRLAGVTPGRSWANAWLKRDEAHALCIEADTGALRAALGSARPATIDLPLEFETLSPHTRVPLAVTLPLRWPGALHLALLGAAALGDDGVFRFELRTERVHELTLVLSNAGGRPVTITRLEHEGGDGRVHLLAPQPSVAAPLEVGATGERVQFAVDLRGKEPGILSVRIRSFRPDGQEDEGCAMEFRSTHSPAFEGAVALDFGTSYSCLAAWRPDRREPETELLIGGSRRVHIARGRGSPLLATSILYSNHPAADFRVGEAGREPTERQVSWAPPLFSAKRHIGTGRSLLAGFNAEKTWRSLDADVVCADIIGALLEGGEDILGARIERCALSHPVRFSPRQLAALSAALQTRGIEVGRMMPEPVAAAIAYAMRNPPAPDAPGGYHLLVFDVGGGTTDVAVVHVHDGLRTRGERVIKPSLLAVGGLRWAGGDDLTWLILRNALLTGEQHDDERWAAAFECDPSQIPQVRELLRDGDMRRRAAEGPLANAFTVAEREKRGPRTGNEHLVADDTALRRLVDRFLEEHEILELAHRALQDAKSVVPDRVLLVGSSWRIDALRERVGAEFPSSELVVLEAGGERRLKEVVALGLCAAEYIDTFVTGFDVDLSDIPTFATARIGYAGLEPSTGDAVFREVIPANQVVGEWRDADMIPLYLNRRMRILENTGGRDHLERIVTGASSPNPEIDVVGTIILGQHLGGSGLTDEVLQRDGRLKMRLTEQHQVELLLEISGRPAIPPLVLDRPAAS
ncbi:MAG: molecular chaperone HscC [Gemmatimonadetes bacterium]|nr:molecular chaperone HscC [Gemmatimonadota bacterium]